jgi:hypothetical protein
VLASFRSVSRPDGALAVTVVRLGSPSLDGRTGGSTRSDTEVPVTVPRSSDATLWLTHRRKRPFEPPVCLFYPGSLSELPVPPSG